MPTFYEFFAGAGMARAGLGSSWTCLFANDLDRKKSASYNLNWGEGELRTGDIRQINASHLPGYADLAWASFPCQDLSLAGTQAGLKGRRSGTFWPFWDVIEGLGKVGRAPKLIVIENVCGAITANKGADLAAICDAFSRMDYRYGAIIIDAKHFVPQSRPRLFIVGVRANMSLPEKLTLKNPSHLCHSTALATACAALPLKSRNRTLWWCLPSPTVNRRSFSDILEHEPMGVAWHTPGQTERLIPMMSGKNRAKLDLAKQAKRLMVGGLYKRTRFDDCGRKVQRAEVRFDGLAGCLRTPGGGSSRQTIIVVNGESVRTRLISSRETARLMGLDDDYILPTNYNEAYHLIGDGVAVPVVKYLSEHLLQPILAHQSTYLDRAAA